MPTQKFNPGDAVRIVGLGSYAGMVGAVQRYEPVLDASGGYPYVVRVGDVIGAFKEKNLTAVEVDPHGNVIESGGPV